MCSLLPLATRTICLFGKHFHIVLVQFAQSLRAWGRTVEIKAIASVLGRLRQDRQFRDKLRGREGVQGQERSTWG